MVSKWCGLRLRHHPQYGGIIRISCIRLDPKCTTKRTPKKWCEMHSQPCTVLWMDKLLHNLRNFEMVIRLEKPGSNGSHDFLGGGCGSKIKQEGLRRCWSMFPLTTDPFWYRFLSQPFRPSTVWLGLCLHLPRFDMTPSLLQLIEHPPGGALLLDCPCFLEGGKWAWPWVRPVVFEGLPFA